MNQGYAHLIAGRALWVIVGAIGLLILFLILRHVFEKLREFDLKAIGILAAVFAGSWFVAFAFGASAALAAAIAGGICGALFLIQLLES